MPGQRGNAASGHAAPRPTGPDILSDPNASSMPGPPPAPHVPCRVWKRDPPCPRVSPFATKPVRLGKKAGDLASEAGDLGIKWPGLASEAPGDACVAPDLAIKGLPKRKCAANVSCGAPQLTLGGE